MTLLKNEFKTARPALGTTFEIYLSSLVSHNDLYQVAERAFKKVESLEKIFNFYDENSLLSKVNEAPPHLDLEIEDSFYSCLSLAIEIYLKSKGAFSPFLKIDPSLESPLTFSFKNQTVCVRKNSEVKIDLGGIAKGFIVDEVAKMLETADSKISGFINVGGDTRYFGKTIPTPLLRLGFYNKPFVRKYKSPSKSIATSSLAGKLRSYQSKTYYQRPFRSDIPQGFTAVASSNDCSTADAMTKVALFGDLDVIPLCCDLFKSQVLIFDSVGQVAQGYGFK